MHDLTPVHLRDGTEAFVVPLVPANREALREEYEHLSAETRFDRSLTAVPKLTASMLDHLVDAVDGSDHAGPGVAGHHRRRDRAAPGSGPDHSATPTTRPPRTSR